MSFEQIYQTVLDEHISVVQQLRKSEVFASEFEIIAKLLLTTFRSGNKLLLCGNGGSAADAQHIATEFVSRFYLERRALDAEALNINTSSITAIGNDYSFDKAFSRQVEAKGRQGDLLIGITTSGTSKNIIAAFEVGKKLGLYNICFSGEKAPLFLDQLCEVVIRIPSSCTPRIQEAHILLGHFLCEYVEQVLFKP